MVPKSLICFTIIAQKLQLECMLFAFNHWLLAVHPF